MWRVCVCVCVWRVCGVSLCGRDAWVGKWVWNVRVQLYLVLIQSCISQYIKRVRCHQEMLMLFWKIMVYNNGFTLYVLSQGDVTSLVSPILHFMNEGRKDEGMVYQFLCSCRRVRTRTFPSLCLFWAHRLP